ncbi:MAG TPA: tRNA preQ1(34) S-adenosylmethionine ribosyltransferase-isomerase QueA [Alphaproteobacteria bacterium]|nr:tRNA preQ1(34) S-adenosylmethionine ribosyltransferase-isomerase QueA [Alphaproteobacteria bacterium]
MTEQTRDWRTDDFDFDLPQDRIAQSAIEPRDHARLLHVTQGDLTDRHIYDLPDLLRAGDVLVVNDTKVIPARIYGKRGEVSIEILLHKKEGPQSWLAFARPGKRLRVNDDVVFADNFSATVAEKFDDGQVRLHFSVTDEKLYPLLQKYGEPPLPPYIKREKGEARQDEARYQTVYASREGAVAAPTAGLHFTPELLKKLDDKGVKRATVTLHVGAGTFLPVKAERIKDHAMHAEWGEVSADAADIINQAKQQGGRIIAVGTTSLRLLESAADENGVVKPFAADTSIFIYPGCRIKTADMLLTNFHLPKSTLFMLVSAFMGLDAMRVAYKYAIDNNYRFYSFGDATLLERR